MKKRELIFESELIQFWREIVGKEVVVKVQPKGRQYANYAHRIYRFPNVNIEFYSPYLSWENLNYCGGWWHDDKYLLTAVQKNKKLYADISEYIDPDRREEKEQKLELLKQNLPAGILAGEYINYNDKFFSFFICRSGCLQDYFDLEEVFAAYKKLGIDFRKSQKEKIKAFCSSEIRLFGSNIPFNYGNSETPEELVVTGLLLGYPIESTAAIISEPLY